MRIYSSQANAHSNEQWVTVSSAPIRYFISDFVVVGSEANSAFVEDACLRLTLYAEASAESKAHENSIVIEM